MKPLNLYCFFKHCHFFLLMFVLFCCSKNNDNNEPEIPLPPTQTEIIKPIDSGVASTVGFFLDHWQAKTFLTPAYTTGTTPSSATTTVTVDATTIIAKIPISIFGQNGNNWSGKLNETSFVTDLTNL